MTTPITTVGGGFGGPVLARVQHVAGIRHSWIAMRNDAERAS